MLLMNDSDLYKIVQRRYRTMQKDAGPRKWKSGRRAGQIRIYGTKLPFTLEEFWQHALNQVGRGIIACPYCVQSGQNLKFISLETCVWDHQVPKSRGGGWELANLQACCRDCNTKKGEFTFEFFLHLVGLIEKWEDPYDRQRAYKVLDGQGWAHQHHKDVKSESAAIASRIVTESLNLDNF